MGACTNSAYLSQYELPGAFAPVASFSLLQQAHEVAGRLDIRCGGQPVLFDTFYDDANSLRRWQKMGVLAVEMESAALYANARGCKRMRCASHYFRLPFHR
jgi:purine-nucleoside phosphorylase